MAPGFLSRARRFLPWAGLVVLLLGLAGFALWWRHDQPVVREPDWVAVLRVNNRGVGHMEQFDYYKAIEDFEEVERMAPDWLPGRINLGIALLNTAADNNAANLDRAVKIFDEILRKDSDNLHAHHCLGLIFSYRGQFEKAAPHFEHVTRKDPTDAFAWYYLGKQLVDDEERAAKCYERAVELNPYINPAVYGLAQTLRSRNPARFKELLEVHERLKASEWASPPDPKERYTEMGRYAEVLDRPGTAPLPPTGPIPLFERREKLQVQLSAAARWATTEDLRKSPHGELRAQVRMRFGAVMVVLDYDRDGKPDLFMLGAVVEGGQVRDLLLHNDGAGHFTDVTAKAGLGGPRPSLGCCVADFDNDGHADLFITGIGDQRLFRNTGKGGFEDVTEKAGLHDLRSVCLGAAMVDLDQDGDLDLVVAQVADTPEDALAVLRGGPNKPKPTGGLAVYLNVGEARPASPSVDPPPLTPKFRRTREPAGLVGEAVHAVGLAVSDLDHDQDLDLLVLSEDAGATAVLNDRLLRFHREPLLGSSPAAFGWNGALVLDVNHDEQSDLLLVGPGRHPVLLLSRAGAGAGKVSDRFAVGAVKSPSLVQALAVDLDHDGWTDVVGLSEQHQPVLLHNDGQNRLVHVPEALGRDADWPKDLVGLAVAEFNGGKYRDLMVWSETTGLQLYVNGGNANQALKLDLTGHRRVEPAGLPVRCNADGFGTWVSAQAGPFWTGAEYTTLSAGLGQSHQPLVLGLGKHSEADVVRLRWPDLCVQAEFGIPVGHVARVEERNRKRTSCPLLFAWNGQRFDFVTDFLGAGTLGECLPGGAHNTPRPEESVKIEPGQLKPLHGEYVLKLAEPMDEVTYLDRLQLVVLDHPADVRVYPDERFVDVAVQPPPSQDLLAFRQQVFPVKARDHHGRDVTDKLRQWDRDTVSDFARRAWTGFAEEHWVELDFGDRLAKLGAGDRVYLCLAGWTDYPYPESIWAADQAGIAVQPPVLERLGEDGQWRSLGEAGFPAGLPRMMTLDVTGKLGGPRCVIRLRTNMQVHWDQIYAVPLVETVDGIVRGTPLEVSGAELSFRGCMKEFSPDGRAPTLYDYDRLDAFPVSRLSGKMTRFGDVTQLLRATDDCYVIFGPGDELTVRFDARSLPELPSGWTRSFVLRTWGYCKDCAPFTATGETIEPLPFRTMKTYPYGPEEHYPRDPVHEDYRRRYNTRQVGRK